MVIRALWSSLFDSHVELTADERALVLARAVQTAELEALRASICRSFGIVVWLRKLKFREVGLILKGCWVAVVFWLGFLLVNNVLENGWWSGFWAVFLFAVSGVMLIFGIVVVVSLVHWIPGWLARPWLIEHVRRAICDFEFDEICYRCGYRLKEIPWEVVQCSECGAVRERVREIPAKERAALTPKDGLPEPEFVEGAGL